MSSGHRILARLLSLWEKATYFNTDKISNPRRGQSTRGRTSARGDEIVQPQLRLQLGVKCKFTEQGWERWARTLASTTG